MFQRGVSLMRGKDLNVAPGKTDEIRLELGGRIADCAAPLAVGKEREIEDSLPHIRLPPMNKISEIGHTDGIDLFAREENVKNRIHCSHFVRGKG
jgi:hypothetical protein